MKNKKNQQGFKKAPAPWTLKGDGYIFIYRFKKKFIREKGFILPFFQDKLSYGFGAMMVVNYKSSNVGPYSELLFIPGLINYRKRKYFSISKIFVNSVDSMANGKANWGIPKEMADFKIEASEKGSEKINVSVKGKPVISLIAETGKFSFSFNNNILPVPLIHLYDRDIFFSSIIGTAKIKFAKLKEIAINPELFPEIDSFRPLVSFKVENFTMVLPEAELEKS